MRACLKTLFLLMLQCYSLAAVAQVTESVSFAGDLAVQGIFYVSEVPVSVDTGSVLVSEKGELVLDGDLYLEEHLSNDGLVSGLSGQLNLHGVNDQSLQGSLDAGNNLHKLVVNKVSGAVDLNASVLLTDSLLLNAGHLRLNEHDLRFSSGAGVPTTYDTLNAMILTNGSGYVQKDDMQPNGGIGFPITPVAGSLATMAFQTDATFIADTLRGRAESGIATQALNEISNACRFVNASWYAEAANPTGATSTDLQLAWSADFEADGFDPMQAALYQYVNGVFEQYTDTDGELRAIQSSGFELDGVFLVGSSMPLRYNIPQTAYFDTICAGSGPINLFDLTIGLDNHQGQWQVGSTGMVTDSLVSLDTLPIGASTFRYSMVELGGCEGDTTQVTIVVTASQGGGTSSLDTVLCTDQSIIDLQEMFPAMDTTGVWLDASQLAVTEVGQPGSGRHDLLYVVDNDCMADTTEVTLNWHPVPDVTLEATPYTSAYNEATLTAAVDSAARYFWVLNLPDSMNLSVDVPAFEPLWYRFSALNQDGCAITDSIYVDYDPLLEIPEAFTPDGDGVNDQFEIRNLDQLDFAKQQVYGRYGALLFESTDAAEFWDGTYLGNTVPFGAYVYMLTFADGMDPISGVVHLIR